LILLFLWIFQVGSLNGYYKWSKKNELSQIVKKVKKGYNKENYELFFDEITTNYDVCIELYSHMNNLYTSGFLNKSCTGDDKFSANLTKKEFLNGNYLEKTYEVINLRTRTQSLMHAIRLSDNNVVFVVSPLQPVDSTIGILKDQFIIVTIMVLLLSILIGYFISNHLSNPIIEINEQAKKLAKGNYDLSFDTDSSIEELNELSTTLSYAAEELSKTEKVRKELMANVSHDLKTPLTMIKAYAEMNRDLNISKKKKEENLNIIINETNRLNVLVNDILQLSVLESNNNLNIEEFNINELILDVLKTYEIYQVKDNYQFIYEENGNIMVLADKKRIHQVLRNLINNAINYTGDDKKITIKVIDKKAQAQIQISDTGKGIKEKDLKYIWDKYYKADKTHSRSQLGTGIGLSIVKAILVNHGAQYGVISKKNKGTTFYFELNKSEKTSKKKGR